MGDDSLAFEELRLSLAENARQPVVSEDLSAALLAAGHLEEARRVALRGIAAGDSSAVLRHVIQAADSALAAAVRKK
jgi:hypothetical protein